MAMRMARNASPSAATAVSTCRASRRRTALSAHIAPASCAQKNNDVSASTITRRRAWWRSRAVNTGACALTSAPMVATAAGLFTAASNEDVVVSARARGLLGNDAAGFVVAPHGHLVELHQEGRVLANERHQFLGGEVQSHGWVNRHHIGRCGAPQQKCDLADDVPWTERCQHEGLPTLGAYDGNLPRYDEVQTRRLARLGDELVTLFVDARLEPLDQRRALFGSYCGENGARAPEVLHHGSAAGAGQPHGHPRHTLRDRVESNLA